MNWQSEGDPQLFLQYNYAETKELCKQFLTLVVAVLVFSLTLSEKIVQFHHAPLRARWFLGIAWCSMLISIIACGIGLTYMTLAGGDAVYSKTYYLQYAATSYNWIVIAGMCFVAGLVSLILTAMMSVLSSQQTSPNHAMQLTAPAVTAPAPPPSPTQEARQPPQ